MIASLLATLSIACGAPSSPALVPVSPVVADSSYRALYESGQTFAAFVESADRRKEEWQANFDKQAAADAVVTRAIEASKGGWKLLVVTVPGCSDSVNSIPYLASLVGHVPGLEMRLVLADKGRHVMEAHRTPDGRAATPTVILLDASFTERGCWIERPAPLIEYLAAEKEKSGDAGLFEAKMKWYDTDRGASSLEDIVQVIEAAAAGGSRCGPASSGTR